MKDPFDIVINRFDNRGYRESLGGVNPTGASAIMKDEKGEEILVGKCIRQVWYSKKKVPRTNPPTKRNKFLFLMGNAIEEYLQEMWEGAGILLGGNIKLRQNIASNPDKDEPIWLSGEVDALLRDCEIEEGADGKERVIIDPYKAIGIEVKTTYGYHKKKSLMGAGNDLYRIGFPQIEHLMQTALYLHTRKVLENYYGVEIPYFVIVYMLRDSGETTSFRIELEDGYDGRVIVKDIDGNEIKPNIEKTLEWGVDVRPIELTIDAIKKRFKQQIENLKSDTPPAREFSLRYSEKDAKSNFEKGKMSKTAFKKWESNPLEAVGDWNCSYCDWKDVCYPQGIFTVDVENGILTIDEALEKYGIGQSVGWIKGEGNVEGN